MNFSFDVMFAVLAAIGTGAVNNTWRASALNDLFGSEWGIDWYDAKHLKKSAIAASERVKPCKLGWSDDDLLRLRDVFIEEVRRRNNLEKPKMDFGFSKLGEKAQ